MKLLEENIEIPAGRLESKFRDYTVKLESGFKTEEDFRNLVIKKGKWRRWSNANSSKDLKFKLAAHYHYKTKEYENLIKKINQHYNFNFFIVKYLVEVINKKLK